ncbi:hypothetical protein BC938DRAFT_480366 [Jimgerdemannia flammicorona]|uniref:Uncharacterized protein n=1 Tax=Jimgerdemannia flammicorona TaxID=994334 RepID=A0A433QIN7_9FUNG|nr:hypothetical protein BC938DRAFT_480366 [Jimgerdemannia flammicorona]
MKLERSVLGGKIIISLYFVLVHLNKNLHNSWPPSIFALDRFTDFVSDQVIYPVVQYPGYLTPVHDIDLIYQANLCFVWKVHFASLLDLKYVITVCRNLIGILAPSAPSYWICATTMTTSALSAQPLRSPSQPTSFCYAPPSASGNDLKILCLLSHQSQGNLKDDLKDSLH